MGRGVGTTLAEQRDLALLSGDLEVLTPLHHVPVDVTGHAADLHPLIFDFAQVEQVVDQLGHTRALALDRRDTLELNVVEQTHPAAEQQVGVTDQDM